MKRDNIIRIGTRGSQLAVAQTDMVIEELKDRYPEWDMEKVILRTKGDQILDKPLIDFGGKGVFITEFENALREGRIDLAVHSAKDMPMELSEGMVIAGVLPRADTRDVLVTKKGVFSSPCDLAKKTQSGAQEALHQLVIGTGSLRRQLQLKALFPGVHCISIRGNVPTRLQKIREGLCDGVVLAAAGLKRLGLLEEPDFDYRYFSHEEMIPAGGQGIIAIEAREGDAAAERIRHISDRSTWMELETERYVLQLLEAGCHEAVGVISRVNENEITIQIMQEDDGITYRKRGRAKLEERLELAKEMVKQSFAE